MTKFKLIEGAKSKGICQECEAIVNTTFKKGDFKAPSGKTYKDLILGYCDDCGTLVSIPHESALSLRGA
jgi:hypothetical protein